MTLVDDCIKRITNVVEWPEGKLPDQVQHVFPAFCAYVAFNMEIKYPFFEALSFALHGKEVLLFKHICDNDFNSSMLLADEAYEMMMYLGVDEVRTILDIYRSYGSLSSDTYISILESLKNKDDSNFSDTICKYDHSDLLCKLGMLRYILFGSKKGTLQETNNIKYCNWFTGCNWEDYCKSEENDACVRRHVSSIIREWVLGITRRELSSVIEIQEKLRFRRIPNLVKINYELLGSSNKRYYDGWLEKWISQQNPTSNDMEVAKLLIEEIEISSTCQHMANEIMFTPFYNHPKMVEKYLSKIVETPEQNKYLRSKAQDFLQKSPNERWEDLYLGYVFENERFGDYILVMLYKIAEVFTYVSGIVDVKERELLEWILQRSSYYNIFTEIKQQISGEHSSQNSDKLSAALKEWENKKNIEVMDCFNILPPLSENQIESLLNGLSEKGYVHKSTTKDALLFVLGGGKKPSSFKPVIWVKKTKKGQLNKRALLNLLRLLNVDWQEIYPPKKLNYLFLCYDGDGYSPFERNNINTGGEVNAQSENNEELKSIIKDALGSHFICSTIEKRELKKKIVDIK